MNKYTYEIIETSAGSNVIKRTDADGKEAWIPAYLGNSDYQAYLESLNDDTETE